MSKKGKKGKTAKCGYKDLKVRPETYLRLRVYQNKMELLDLETGETVSYSMDRVISALLDFVESTEITREEDQNGEEEKTQQGRTSSS